MIRAVILCLAFAVASPAWQESVEFPWNTYPRPLWERELVWLKNIGIRHISLPPAKSISDLTELIGIIRRLAMEADLEGAVPDSLRSQTTAHGGPLTEPLTGTTVRLSALAADAGTHARESLASGATALVWTDVEETLGGAGYKSGAVNFAGQEKPATVPLRRDAQLAMYWDKTFPALHTIPGVGITRLQNAAPVQTPAVRQFGGETGASVVSVVNKSANPWTGELRVFYAPAKHLISLPVMVSAQDALWLPVNVPLTAGPLCKDCTAFANTDHLVYATAELTTMEYENGILAMEFAAPRAGEVILQLSREPSGPLVAGGKPAEFDWDEHTQRARLKIPAGSGPGSHVRIGLAIEPPDATAFFDSARVLLIGETNALTAQFSSEAIAQRSRMRITPAFENTQDKGKEPLGLVYKIAVPVSAVNGDHASLSIEADGMRMSHATPQLLRPVSVRFPEALDIHLSATSALPLFPATIPVNQRSGREITVTLRNNAPEIRTFVLEPGADGLDFSPAKTEVTVGASAARDVTFRVFANQATPGLHAGSIAVSGATSYAEAFQLAVLPQTGAAAYGTSGSWVLENSKARASFIPGRWLEYINKENNQNLLPAGGVVFVSAGIEAKGDSLVFDGGRTIHLEDLEPMIPRQKR